LCYATLKVQGFIAGGIMACGANVLDSPCRTRFCALGTLAAQVFQGLVGEQLEIGQDRNEPDSRAMFRINDQQALSLPSQTSGDGHGLVGDVRVPAIPIEELRSWDRLGLSAGLPDILRNAQGYVVQKRVHLGIVLLI
jgi:hypothetical protein